MVYTEEEARDLVLQAGRRLLRSGLTARTWGNISARVSDSLFVITPSGLSYEEMQPEDLVLVSLSDGSCQGRRRPSSERGIHAAAYRLRPQVRFVIHTHQHHASVAGVLGEDLPDVPYPLLGGRVPCAAYGLPGTAKLRRAVSAQLEAWPDSPAVLLRRHGALCLGRSMEEAFDVAQALEEACGNRIHRASGAPADLRPPVPDYGYSERRGDAFLLVTSCRRQVFWTGDRKLPPAAALHAAVYRGTAAQYAAHEADPAVVSVSRTGQPLRPLLDDLAQIAGADIRCAEAEPTPAVRALRGRNAVLLRGAGALCIGTAHDDLEAVRLLLRKGCAAYQFAQTAPGCRPLGRLDALLQRAVYVNQYARKKSLC